MKYVYFSGLSAISQKRSIAMQFVDMHCHILPGLDDGAFQTEDSIQMADVALSGLTAGIVCTPHRLPDCEYTVDELKKIYFQTFSLIKNSGKKLTLFLGQEILVSESITPIINGLKNGTILTLNGSVYPLIEFDFSENPEFVFRTVSAFTANGFTPIIAHPERYDFLADDPDTAWELKEIGALLQVNKGSPGGAFGRNAAQMADFLFGERLADFVASDAHSPYIRTPFMQEAHEWISENYSPEYADHLMFSNPLRVLKNEKVHSYR